MQHKCILIVDPYKKSTHSKCKILRHLNVLAEQISQQVCLSAYVYACKSLKITEHRVLLPLQPCPSSLVCSIQPDTHTPLPGYKQECKLQRMSMQKKKRKKKTVRHTGQNAETFMNGKSLSHIPFINPPECTVHASCVPEQTESGLPAEGE